MRHCMIPPHDVNSVINWFPWMCDNANEVDRRVLWKLESGNLNLTQSDLTIITRWYSHTPPGLRTWFSDELADCLSKSTMITV